MESEPEAIGQFTQQFKKTQITTLARKDLPLLQATVNHMIPATFDIKPKRPCHENNA
jgi:hypothetical protein